MKIRLNKFRFVRGCIGGGSTSSTSQPVTTTSGATSPIASGSEANIAAPGSIAVGKQGKYQEQGSIDLSGSQKSGVGGTVGTIEAGQGATVTIGDTNALSTISGLANQFASTVQAVAPGAAAPATPASTTEQPLNYKTITLIVAGIAVVIGLFGWLFGKKRV